MRNMVSAAEMWKNRKVLVKRVAKHVEGKEGDMEGLRRYGMDSAFLKE